MQRFLCEAIKSVSNRSDHPPLRLAVIHFRPTNTCVINAEIINAMIDLIDVPFEISLIRMIGIRSPDGKWNGAIGQLVNNKSDMIVSPLLSDITRFEAGQLSAPLTFSSPISILSGKLSHPSATNDFHVFNTFGTNVWVGIIISILVIGLIDHLIHFKNLSFNDIIYHILSAFKCVLAQNSFDLGHVCCLKHVALLGLYLFSTNILINNFKTYIFTDLITDNFIKIDSIFDLYDFLKSSKKNISVVSDDRILTWHLLQTSKASETKFIFSKMSPATFDTFNFEEVYHGRRIVIFHSQYLEYTIKVNPHLGLHLSRDQYYGSSMVNLYSKTFDKNLKERIDAIMNWLNESGLYDLWTFNKFTDKINITEKEVDHRITMKEIKGLNFLLINIYSGTLIILILEIIYHFGYNNQ